MIASEIRHNTNILDASFPSYAAQESFRLKTKKNVEDDELGIFGAEKYFTGAIDEDLRRTSDNKGARYRISNRRQENEEPAPKLQTPKTPSVRSESSSNSRRGLLVSNGNDDRKKKCVRSLLSFCCNCNEKAFVKITDKKLHVKELPVKQRVKSGDLGQKPKSLSSRWADEDVRGKKFELNESNIKREDCFTKHSDPPEVERRYSSEAFCSPVLEKGKKKKLTMLNWDGVTPKLDISRNGGDKDTGSDASSDLFEIESFSTTENNTRLESYEGMPISNANGYAPSEASIVWSVVTASAADSSAAEDFPVSRTVNAEKVKASSGILSGCKSHKAVRVSGDKHRMITGGGEKTAAPAMVAPVRREWCHRLDSATPVAKIQADTKLMGGMSDSNRGQKGFDTGHHLYIQK